MKTQEILSIVALSLLGLCLLCGLAKMAMKKDSAKKNCDKACSMAVFAAVVLIGVSQLIGETEKYTKINYVSSIKCKMPEMDLIIPFTKSEKSKKSNITNMIQKLTRDGVDSGGMINIFKYLINPNNVSLTQHEKNLADALNKLQFVKNTPSVYKKRVKYMEMYFSPIYWSNNPPPIKKIC